MDKTEFCTHCEWTWEKTILVPVEGLEVITVSYNPKCLCEGCKYATSYEANEEGTYSNFTWTAECHRVRGKINGSQ